MLFRNVSLSAEIGHLARIEEEKVGLKNRILELEEELIRSTESYQEKISSLESMNLGTKQVIFCPHE